MDLKRQDVVLAVLVGVDRSVRSPRLSDLASATGMSISQVYTALRRARRCHLVGETMELIDRDDTGRRGRPVGAAVQTLVPQLMEFLAHGVRYAFPAELGGATRGIPTGHGAPILRRQLSTKAKPPVWAHPLGKARGEQVEPLYRNVPSLALADGRLHNAFALIDLLRLGGARERSVAIDELQGLFKARR